MPVLLRGAQIRFQNESECFHIILPATLVPIIGRRGWLSCRLDAVHRTGRPPTPCSDQFEATFDASHRLILPRELANRRGLSIDARIDMALVARRLVSSRWMFWRTSRTEPIYPDEDVMVDQPQDSPPAGTVDRKPARPSRARQDDSAADQARLDTLRRQVASDMAAIQAAIDAPEGEREMHRMRMALTRAQAGADTMPAQDGTGPGSDHEPRQRSTAEG